MAQSFHFEQSVSFMPEMGVEMLRQVPARAVATLAGSLAYAASGFMRFATEGQTG